MIPWLHDFRYACRLLRSQPAFSGVAILTLALGIGATTAAFALVYGVLLRPLPYRDPARLVTLFYGHRGQVSPWLSPSNLRDYVAQSDVFAGAAALEPITANMTGFGDPERVSGARVSSNYFTVLGASMARGRAFTEADNQGDSNRMVLSYGLWQRRFWCRPESLAPRRASTATPRRSSASPRPMSTFRRQPSSGTADVRPEGFRS